MSAGTGRGRRRVLIVSFYFPPAGGGGVQRVLKLCKHLPEAGWDVEVLAPDDPRWVAVDPGLAAEIPPGTVVHRARYRGPSQERAPEERLRSARGARRLATRAALFGRKLLVPDPSVPWLPDAARAGRRIVRERGIDAGLTTSPPMSAHLVGSAIARRAGVPWVADFRDSWLANPHRRYDRRSVRAKRRLLERIARRALGRVSGISAVTEVIAEEARALAPGGTPVRVISNGCDFDDFEGLRYEPGEKLRILHAGYFFGARTPRPFLQALTRLFDRRPELRGAVEVRFIGGFREADRAWAEELGLGEALAVDGFVPHDGALRAMKEADALLLLIPNAGGLGTTVLSGKLFEYLAAERPVLGLVPPEGAAAALLRETGLAWIADPDDLDRIEGVLEEAYEAWAGGALRNGRVLPHELRERLDRRARAAELAALLEAVA